MTKKVYARARSASFDGEYAIYKDTSTGVISCSCPGYFHRYTCRHIEDKAYDLLEPATEQLIVSCHKTTDGVYYLRLDKYAAASFAQSIRDWDEPSDHITKIILDAIVNAGEYVGPD